MGTRIQYRQNLSKEQIAELNKIKEEISECKSCMEVAMLRRKYRKMDLVLRILARDKQSELSAQGKYS